MPFPFLFEEPERKLAHKANNSRSGRSGESRKSNAGQVDEEMNAAGRKAVRPARMPGQEPKLTGRAGQQHG